MEIDINNFISIASSDDINKINQKFFKRKKLNINHLNYIHKNNDGSIYYLCSNYKWIKHYISNNYMSIGAFETKPYLTKDRYVLWDTLESDDVILKDSKNLINVEHGITIINKDKNGCGFFNFGTNNSSGIDVLNTYINNLSILESFILYFYEEAKNIIYEANNQSLIIPSKSLSLNISRREEKTKKLLSFTKRERDCINWFLKGKNSADIAIILGLSRRTIETYMENVKIKLGCKTLFQVGYYLSEMNYLINIS